MRLVNFFKRKYHVITLVALLILGAFLRLYELSGALPALTQDEAVNGYDAYALAHTLRDQHGSFLPLIFSSFGDSVSVALTYITVPFVRLGGLDEFTTRLPIALTGIASILLVYLLIKEVTHNKPLALLGAFVLCISPWHITLTRWAVPPSLVPFSLLLFLWLLSLAVNRTRSKSYLLVAAGLAGGLLTYSYPAAEILSPLLIFTAGLIFLYQQYRNLLIFWLSYGLSVFPLFYLIIFRPASNFARFSSVRINDTGFELIKDILSRYKDYFSYDFYFGPTASNPIMHVPGIGNLYSFFAIFIPIAVLIVLFNYRKSAPQRRTASNVPIRIGLFMIIWALLGPIPAAISVDYKHVTRAIFMWPLITLIVTGAVYIVLQAIRKNNLRYGAVALVIMACFLSLKNYMHIYTTSYPKQAAASFQYGVKQGYTYLYAHQRSYRAVVVDRNINQPYVYYLFYLPYNPHTLNYDEINASTNNHLSFAVTKLGNYYFDTLTKNSVRGARLLTSVKGYGSTWFDIYAKGDLLIMKKHDDL